MKKLFEKTKMFEEAKQQSKGHFFLVEILIFLVVFVVVEIVSSIPSLVMSILELMQDEHMIEVIGQYNSGEITFEQYTAEMSAFSTSGIMLIVSLFSTGITTLLIFIYCRFIEKRKLSTMGFRKNKFLAEYAVGMLVGTVMFSAAVGICVLLGALSPKGLVTTSSTAIIALSFAGFLIQGMSEEVVFRGYLMVSVSRRSHIALAVAISSIGFACAHLGNPGVTPLAIINIAFFGAFEALYIMKRGNIWGVCGIHSLWNFVQGNFYGISVSGLGNTDSIFRMENVSGHDLINGGAFGLEGGLAVTTVLVISTIAVLFTKTKQSEIFTQPEPETADLTTPE